MRTFKFINLNSAQVAISTSEKQSFLGDLIKSKEEETLRENVKNPLDCNVLIQQESNVLF